MTTKVILKGNCLTNGKVEGEAVVTKQPLNLFAMYMQGFILGQPSSIVGDTRHELFGEDIGGKILVVPYLVGSTTSGVILLEAIKLGVAPKAIISQHIEAFVFTGAVFAELFFDLSLPLLDKFSQNPVKVIKTGDYVKVDGTTGFIEVIKKIKT